MKHLIALALAALMVLSCAGFALAEAQTYDLFSIGSKAMITLTIDRDPLRITSDEAFNELGVSQAVVEADGVAPCRVSIAKSDVTDELSLIDLSEDELEALKDIMSEQFENPEIITGKVNDVGYMAVKNYGDEGHIHTIFTIVNGYFVQTTQYHEDFSKLTEEDGSFAYAVISGLGSRALE